MFDRENYAYDVTDAAEATYESIWNKSKKIQKSVSRSEVHMQSICGMASKILVRELRKRKITAYVYDGTFEKGDEYFEHYYVVFRGARKVLVADPTWIQLLPDNNLACERVEKLPKVLIGCRNEVAQYAVSAGVNPDLSVLWTREISSIDKDVNFPNSKLVTDQALLGML